MATQTIRLVNIFCAYSSEDAELRYELEMHLSVLRRLDLIRSWYNYAVDTNDQNEQEEAYIQSANIFLLLLSSDFMKSNFIHSSEMQKILEKHIRGQAYAIPILLHPVRWENTSLESLQILPINGQPVSTWLDINEAFVDIARDIHTFVNQYNVVDLERQSARQLFHQMKLIAQETQDLINSSTEKIQTLVATFDGDLRLLFHDLQILATDLSYQNEKLTDSLVASSTDLIESASLSAHAS